MLVQHDSQSFALRIADSQVHKLAHEVRLELVEELPEL